MEKTTIDLMNDILVKLEDIQNSQKSIIEKVSQVQIELFEMPDKELDDSLGTVFQSASEAFDSLKLAIEDYTIKKNVLGNV